MVSRHENAAEKTPDLSDRQASVLRAMVGAYVGEAAPIGSTTLAHLLPVKISSASIRNTLAELTDMGLTEQPHKSAGRVPTEKGLRLFVDRLLDPGSLGAYERRAIAMSLDEAREDTFVNVASQLLSERTHQLGFVVTPRLDTIVLKHVSLVRLSSERVLVVLVSQAGDTHQRILEDRKGGSRASDQQELDRIAALLNPYVAGRTLPQVRAELERDAQLLRRRADRLVQRALDFGVRALAIGDDDADLVIATRRALLDQPEFRDPRRLQELFSAVETKERLLEVLDEMLDDDDRVAVAFGEEVDEPSLRRCALVATHYGDGQSALGVLGVIGPTRMNYARVIPLVEYLSQVISEKMAS
jgi:heat-inducible transcriptional repressor